MTTAPKVNQPALGQMIEERRESLGLTKAEAARLGGMSRGTWHDVEAGKRTHMLAGTLALFDRALGYERGTLRRLSRSPDAPPPAATERPVFVSHSHEGIDDIELRMQLLSYAMTMDSDDVRRIMMLLIRPTSEREGLPAVMRADDQSLDETGGTSRDHNTGPAGSRTPSTQHRAPGTQRRARTPEPRAS